LTGGRARAGYRLINYRVGDLQEMLTQLKKNAVEILKGQSSARTASLGDEFRRKQGRTV
jgi:hypothetical protein